MGSEGEQEPVSSILPKLPLLTFPPMQSPERSGMLTPPLHTSATVPFRWEEEPGKPRPCTAIITTPTTTSTAICLELPPRLQLTTDAISKITKMPSPTTVLDGPYNLKSSSFRFRPRERQGSFGNSPEIGHLGAMVLSKRVESKERGLIFGSWGRRPTDKRGKREGAGGSFDLSPSSELADLCSGDETESGSARVKTSRIRRNGSFSSLSQVRPHFWATIYEGFKQVLPWKSSRKSKKEGSGLSI